MATSETATRLDALRPWIRPIIGIVLVLALTVGDDALGWATAGGKLDPELRSVDQRADIVVTMDFEPERFHAEILSTLGVFAGRGETNSQIRLRSVRPENVRTVSRLFWVESVEVDGGR